jgi:hypothetical protein
MSGWDSPTSDPVADIKRFVEQLKNERWICKGCAKTVIYPPLVQTLTFPWFEILPCSDCGSTDWLHTFKDRVEL